MALTRKERFWLVILVVAVGVASFWAGRISVVIEQLQIAKPITVVGQEDGRGGELQALLQLSQPKPKLVQTQ